jgi:uncharacterized protein YdaU (DUF1376 family)
MTLHFMPFFVGDYLADTRLLNGQEHGAYLLLIFELWQRGKLPTDDKSLAKIACITPRQWKKVKPSISSYFTDGWQHTKVSKVRAKAMDISEKRSAIALEQHSKSKANAVQGHQQEHSKSSGTKLNYTKLDKNLLIDSSSDDHEEGNGAVEEKEGHITMVLRKKIVDKFVSLGLTAPDHLAQIGMWLALGDSPAVILAAVDVGLETRGSKFTSMNYINTILEVQREKAKAPVVVEPPKEVAPEDRPMAKHGSEEHLRNACFYFKKQGMWVYTQFTGSKPGEAGCLIPARLLEEYGLPPTPPYRLDAKGQKIV